MRTPVRLGGRCPVDGERHARLHDLLVDERDVAWLVVLQADRVSQAMRKVFAVARVLNHVARGTVQIAHAHARRDERLGGLVGAAHDIVDALRLLVRLAPKECTRHVRAVVAAASANVEQHHVATLEYGVVGLVMRIAGVAPKLTMGGKLKPSQSCLRYRPSIWSQFRAPLRLVNELDGVDHHGVVGGRGHAHELLLGGILVGA